MAADQQVKRSTRSRGTKRGLNESPTASDVGEPQRTRAKGRASTRTRGRGRTSAEDEDVTPAATDDDNDVDEDEEEEVEEEEEEEAEEEGGDDDDVNEKTTRATRKGKASAAKGKNTKGKGKKNASVEVANKEGEEDEEDYDDVDDTPPDEFTKQDLMRINADRGLAGLLLMMDKFKPILPDPVTDYYLARSGFQSEDVRIKRILGLAAQKFITDIAVNSMQYCLIRSQATTSKDRTKAGSKQDKQSKRKVLAMEDLTMALQDHGINLKKPEYYL